MHRPNILMKIISHCFGVLSVLALTAIARPASAQMTQDPTDWKFSIKKKDATHYTLTASTTIKSGWHIYGLNPGGEGELIGTSFIWDAGSVKADGAINEVTPAKSETILDEKVNLHSGKAVFSVALSGKSGQTASGSVEYQACNDMMCLPPKKKTFSVKLP